MKVLIGLCATSFVLLGCGGRAQLGDTHAKAYRNAFDAQANSSPKKRPLLLSAQDAKTVNDNRAATYSSGGKNKSGGGASSRQSGSNSGGIDPMTGDIGGAEGGNTKIQIKAK